MQVTTPHLQARTVRSLRPAGEGRAYTAATWALKNTGDEDTRESVCLAFQRRCAERVSCVRSRFTKVAGRGLQLAVEAGLGRGETALLVRMLAVKRHGFPMRYHGIGNIERPALRFTNHHTASLSRDETTS